jgi:hypothetical protein
VVFFLALCVFALEFDLGEARKKPEKEDNEGGDERGALIESLHFAPVVFFD